MLTRFLEARAYHQNLGHPAKYIPELVWGTPPASGVEVNERNAVSWTALASGIRLCAETLASLPVDLSKRRERGRDPQPDHPVAQLLKFPNSEMSGFEFVELLQTHIDLWGNGYAQIVFNQVGIPIELWPINPDRVTVERDPRGNLVYRVSLPNEPFGAMTTSTVLPADEVLHVRGWSRYGVLGERMVQTFREAIGLGLATELFGALFFGRGANPSGILEHPGMLSTEAQDRLRKAKENQSGGMSAAQRIMVLEEGMKWHQTTIEPEKAQFLGTRKFQVTEASRMIRVPPHLLYDLERATFSNVEHQGIEFVTYSMLPRAVRWEQRLAMQLLGRKDRHSVQVKFNMAGLLRGDTTAQTAAFTAGRQGGWLSPNDVRELLDMNPRKGGDVYADMPAGAPAQPAAPKADEPEPDDTEADAERALVRDVLATARAIAERPSTPITINGAPVEVRNEGPVLHVAPAAAVVNVTPSAPVVNVTPAAPLVTVRNHLPAAGNRTATVTDSKGKVLRTVTIEGEHGD